MEKEITVSRTTEIKTFKARIKATKPHWIGKAISHRHTVKDGLESRFSTNMTVFMPKLTFKQKRPVVMFHLSNGGGSCLLRSNDPCILADALEHMVDILRSDIWLDMFEQLSSISNGLIDNHELIMDDLFIDTGSFKQEAGIGKNETFPFLTVVNK